MTNLVPHRYQPDLFIADLAAAPLKEMAEHLEFPFFGLPTQPYRRARRFSDEHGNYIELRPGLAGLPTIQDQDIMIYCMSVAMSEVRAGRPVPERVQMHAGELLRFTNRPPGGRQYSSVEAAIYRLTELTLVTNIRGEDAVYTELFGIVDRASMVRSNSLARIHNGALLGCSIVLSSWIREALEARRVLTLHDDYFRLRTPLERAVYQVVRKHCGEQRMWRIGLGKLRAKVGSSLDLPGFRRQIRAVAARWADEDFLGYRIEFDNPADHLKAGHTGNGRRPEPDTQPAHRRITERTLNTLRRELPELDAGLMEMLWRRWAGKQKDRPRNTQLAFLGFCRKYAERREAAGSRDCDGPRPALGESPSAAALRFWQSLTPDQQQAAVREHQLVGAGTDWAFARTEKQIIEATARLWAGIE